MVAFIELPQPFEGFGFGDGSAEAFRLDTQPVVERSALPGAGGLQVGAQRGLGERGDGFGQLEARCRQVPLGTTWLTRPMRSASCASITRPVMIRSTALRYPRIRVSRWVPPSASPMFQRRHVTPNVACSSAMARSVQHAHSSPPA